MLTLKETPELYLKMIKKPSLATNPFLSLVFISLSSVSSLNHTLSQILGRNHQTIPSLINYESIQTFLQLILL